MAKPKSNQADQVVLAPVELTNNTVAVGCRLPHGLILRVMRGDTAVEIELQGMNKSRILGADCVVNAVPADFWEEWKRVNAGTFDPFLNNAIFEAKDYNSASAFAQEIKDEKTGFEPLDPSKEKGVQPLEV